MSNDLGPINVIGADAVGQPGERRFRLFVRGLLGSALVWMEKEQLNSLALTLDRALAMVTEGQVLRVEAQRGNAPQPTGIPDDFPSSPNFEFQVGQMRLSYDDQDEKFLLNISPLEIVMERDQEPQVAINEEESIEFAFAVVDAHQLSTSISLIMNAGRPTCPFCHAVLDGGPHACVKQNGHHKIVAIEEDEEDQE
ncbi:MAG TPA: DUF3090 family protein [Ktedonobacteraceae bacterium]|jgi:uncharacterized repeat protein (TIGR03847 family)|nr:DUF3090 family protein [Ktedonobacteraceae bacterium]